MGRADGVGAAADLARHVARLALPAAGGIAADAVDALSARALTRAGAPVAVRQQGRTDAGRAKAPGDAVRVGRAIAEAHLWTAQIGTAALRLPRRAAAGAVAGGLKGGNARGADRAPAGRLRGWIRACGRARPVADAAASAAVGSARLSRSVRRADHVRASAGRARHVAGLALAVAGGRAAHPVDALTAGALVCPAASDARSALRRAETGGAVVPGEAVGIDRAVAGARRGTTRVRGAGDVLLGRARAAPVA